uniref:Immunoglobulin domain-containing protein n=1 Tax=Maylandia zebra TaxID=106582 RepID=A0A3P9BNB2_9CICH
MSMSSTRRQLLGGQDQLHTRSDLHTVRPLKLTAEAGLCVVIPCSFKTAEGFETQHIVWYKCEASEAGCDRPVMIFHTNKSTDVQPEFEGRVSLIEHVIQNNCSIIINNLKESDSGSYHLRVIGEVNRKTDAFTFIPKVNVSVKGLKQKPTVMIPTLTEGQQATLTCTAPGLSFTQSHVSTLTFNALAKHHNTSITCKISFTDKTTTEGSSTLTVNCEAPRRVLFFVGSVFPQALLNIFNRSLTC